MEETEPENTAGQPETAEKDAAPAEDKQQKSNASEKETSSEAAPKKPRVDYNVMPTRPYLDATVVPILLQGLSALARERHCRAMLQLGIVLIHDNAAGTLFLTDIYWDQFTQPEPPDPIQYLAEFLIRNKAQYSTPPILPETTSS